MLISTLGRSDTHVIATVCTQHTCCVTDISSGRMHINVRTMVGLLLLALSTLVSGTRMIQTRPRPYLLAGGTYAKGLLLCCCAL